MTIRAYIEALYPPTETAPPQEQATSPHEKTIPEPISYIESQISSELMLPREKVGETPFLPTEKEISSPEEKKVLTQGSQPEKPTPESQKETPKNFITNLIKTIIIFFKRILIVNRLVQGKECWIRKSPRLTSFIIEEAPKGTLLIILEAKRPWYKVLNPKTRTVGWIHDSQFIMLEYKPTETTPPSPRKGSCEPEAFIGIKA